MIDGLSGRLQSIVFLYVGALFALRASSHFSECYSGLLVSLANLGAVALHVVLVLVIAQLVLAPIWQFCAKTKWAKAIIAIVVVVFGLPVHLMFVEFISPTPGRDVCSSPWIVSTAPLIELKSR